MSEKDKIIQKFIDDCKFKQSLVLAWKTWRWKTHIMTKLYSKLSTNEIMKTYYKYWIDDWQVREYINAWIMNLKNNTKDNTNEYWAYPLEMCVRCKYLFFDDLGASENVSDPQKTKLKYILDERHKRGLINIFSTNCSPQHIEKLYGERIKSRIYDGTKNEVLIITVDGEDRRKKQVTSIKLW